MSQYRDLNRKINLSPFGRDPSVNRLPIGLRCVQAAIIELVPSRGFIFDEFHLTLFPFHFPISSTS